MINLIIRIFFLFLSNLAAIWTAAYFVSGFDISFNLNGLIEVAIIFTALNFLIKPIIKLILSPIIIITLGLGIILVNGVILYMLDFFSENITITGLTSLFYATLVISVVNFIIHLFIKKFKS